MAETYNDWRLKLGELGWKLRCWRRSLIYLLVVDFRVSTSLVEVTTKENQLPWTGLLGHMVVSSLKTWICRGPHGITIGYVETFQNVCSIILLVDKNFATERSLLLFSVPNKPFRLLHVNFFIFQFSLCKCCNCVHLVDVQVELHWKSLHWWCLSVCHMVVKRSTPKSSLLQCFNFFLDCSHETLDSASVVGCPCHIQLLGKVWDSILAITNKIVILA